MLIEAEQKWRLERGLSLLENGYYSCKDCPNHTDEKNMWTGHCWIEEGSFCPVEHSGYRDAAEFEARVAVYLAKSPCLTCPDNKQGGCCTRKMARGRDVVEACRLKHARLAVEQEME